MDYFDRRDGRTWCEETALSEIAEQVGTPAFVYSRRTLELHFDRLKEAFSEVDPLICFAVKANGNLSVLRVLQERGAGFDVVSGGEILKALEAGADPKSIVFAGVGKTPDEIGLALDKGILMFNVESEGELDVVASVARDRGVTADVALRVNPDVDPKTHQYISTGKRESKFGVDLERAARIADRIPTTDGVRMIGVHAHIGSQITEVEPHVEALGKAIRFAAEAREAGNPITHLNMGGGFGIYYLGGEARPAAAFGEAIVPLVKEAGLRLVMEPGRFIAGNAGVMLSRVLYVKESGDRRFLIVDGAMNDLLRPALYGAYHGVWPDEAAFGEDEAEGNETWTCDVVGPVCETGDFLARDRELPRVNAGDLLVVRSAGAYAMTMSSNYNARPRAAEVLVEGDAWKVVRPRETYDDLVRSERGY